MWHNRRFSRGNSCGISRGSCSVGRDNSCCVISAPFRGLAFRRGQGRQTHQRVSSHDTAARKSCATRRSAAADWPARRRQFLRAFPRPPTIDAFPYDTSLRAPHPARLVPTLWPRARADQRRQVLRIEETVRQLRRASEHPHRAHRGAHTRTLDRKLFRDRASQAAGAPHPCELAPSENTAMDANLRADLGESLDLPSGLGNSGLLLCRNFSG